MRRWNGWGDDTITYPLPTSAARFLERLVGSGVQPVDVTLEEIIKTVPESRLPPHPLVSTEPYIRLCHARGQSLPDWIDLRFGLALNFPDGVAFPASGIEVCSLMDYAKSNTIRLIPYGGGTSVVGHINPYPGVPPTLTVSLERMNRMVHFYESSLLATFGAGVAGPDLEAQLRARGCTLGHFPQSFEYSTLGGWVATRSSGQQSLHYGRIEKLFAGGTLVSPMGKLELPSFPASAAGPDLRELILGSEGRLGILTEIVVRAALLPEREDYHAVFFPDFDHGQAAVRQILQSGLPLSMLRLSTAIETTTTLALAGHERMIAMLESLLSVRGMGSEKCLLLLGFTGSSSFVRHVRSETLAITSQQAGVHVGKTFGAQWQKGRFRTPYLRNTLWKMGYAIDTLETATDWNNVFPTLSAIETALHEALLYEGEQVHVFTHLSHVYPSGSSIYTTYLFRLGDTPEKTLLRWKALKDNASRAIIAHRGTISHQHGVGQDHAQYLSAEKGSLGISALSTLIHHFDPDGLMNPGKLIHERETKFEKE